MPSKSKRRNARVAPELIETRPEVPTYAPLQMEERDELAAILRNPVFIKAWMNVECSRPSAFPRMDAKFEGEHGAYHAASALYRIQGWELHKAALIRQSLEVAQKSAAPKDEYSDSGSLEAEVARSLAKKTPNQK